MKISVVTPPELEPVTLAQAKAHLQLYADQVEDDAYIQALIGAAREKCEGICPVSLITRTLKASLPCFLGSESPGWRRSACSPIQLPRPPVQSITSVAYLDASGALQTLDTATYVLSPGVPSSLSLAPGKSWPSTISGRPDAVQITFVAGCGDDPTAVPSVAKLAIMQLVAHWFARREPVSGQSLARVPFTVEALLDTLDPGIYP